MHSWVSVIFFFFLIEEWLYKHWLGTDPLETGLQRKIRTAGRVLVCLVHARRFTHDFQAPPFAFRVSSQAAVLLSDHRR